ncbi:MAG: lytic murein transglycosylase B [Gammaproteobacteria bacterium]|nr:MAG: lytic murein transglycosylase B [Gammaproteobacteria bacterium]
MFLTTRCFSSTVLLLFALFSTASHAITRDSHPALGTFIDNLSIKYNFETAELEKLFSQATIRQDIIRAMARPAEKKPWYKYRPIFVTQQRIEGGVNFWKKHHKTLARAEREYGVAAEVIVAIIGVETRYGKHTGRYRVIDSLSTLAFAYPPRARFFTSELEQFIIMARETKLDPLSLKGSYAGAMGQPQFISSSYRNYAVDFDGDNLSDIWRSPADAIGSVANYFKKHGWRSGQPVAENVELKDIAPEAYSQYLGEGLKPIHKVAAFRNLGIRLPESYQNDDAARLIQLEVPGGYEYWIGLQNFYAITRYNHSALYAMAVHQLSRKIRERYMEMLEMADG